MIHLERVGEVAAVMPTLSLFSGIEGFALGLESTGAYRVTHAVEIEDYPREVIAKRYPHVELHRDVTEFDGRPLRDKIAVICGGFPCQDISGAGKGEGIKGNRSGLWSEYARIVGEVEPELVIIENVRDLLHRGMEVVIDDLTSLGYCVEWDCLPAAAFGAWHLRDRIWIVAHRGGCPMVFGEPIGLFARPPGETGGEYGKWSRAGFTTKAGEHVELQPLAPVSAVKAGVLVPTPVAHDDGKTSEAHMAMKSRMSGGARHTITSLAVLARNGFVQADGRVMLPTVRATDGDRGGRGDLVQAVRGNSNSHFAVPTPVAGDAKVTRNATANRSNPDSKHHAGTTLTDYVEMFPTPTSRGWKDVGEGRYGRGQLPEAVRDRAMLPTPKASPSGPDFARAGRDGSGGDDLATFVARAEFKTPTAAPASHGGGGGELHKQVTHMPTPTASRRTGLQSHGRNVVKGGLNPVWVEWLMGFPMGWTDLTCDEPVWHPWTSEPEGVPRTAESVTKRQARLKCCGNALVPPAAAWVGARALAATTLGLAA